MTNSPPKAFHALTAEDLMTRGPTLIPRHMSMQAAARLLAGRQISGAPVVDEGGHCVGVLSTTDFMRRVGKSAPVHLAGPHRGGCVCDWELPDMESLPEETVAAIMTRDTVAVPQDTPVHELAGRMIDAHIHRVVVLDEEARPVGVVTSTDILAAVARSVE